MKILVTPTSLQPSKGSAALEKLQAFTNDLVFNELGRPLTSDELIELIGDCDGYIAGLDDVTAEVLAAAPNLKVVSRYGAGVDRVDLTAAKANNIMVTNTPGANAEAVGELAFGLILSCARKIPYLNSSTRAGGWERSKGMELYGKTLGVLGLGAIGKVVARCGQGFGMKVVAYDPYINLDYCAANNITSMSFDELVECSDVITLHLPLLESTHHIMSADALSRMREGTILVNASRGGLIDEDAAYEALKSGKLAGLGLDAFEVEPPSASPLFEFDNVVVTPHTGAHTKEAGDTMAEMAVDNVIAVLSGEDCPYVLNK